MSIGAGSSVGPLPAPVVDSRPPPARALTSSTNRIGGNQGNAARRVFSVPPEGENRFVLDEVILDVAANVPDATLEGIARRHGLTRLQSQDFTLTGRRLFRWRIRHGRSVAAVIRSLGADPRISGAQPNYIYTIQDQSRSLAKGDAGEGDPAQYALAKLRLRQAHRLARGNNVLVAVIDSGIDASHPDLEGVVADQFDALSGRHEPDAHGTAMAGAIAARGRLLGVAPAVRILAVRAFAVAGADMSGTTFHILRGLDWALTRGARIVNMSFAGPSDPALQRALAAARQRGLTLIAAVGNAGPQSKPLFPAADPNVIAVTATDLEDKVFARANRGTHIAVAAPGVDVLVPAPGHAYQLTSGTSVAAAHISGVAALVIERNPRLDPDMVRKILTSTAHHLGVTAARSPEFGAGLADAYEALMSSATNTVSGPPSRIR